MFFDSVKAVYFKSCTNPEQLHAAWMAHKEREGWTYGPTKDEKKKTHPCLVSFHELPVQERVKDTMFISTAAMGILTFEPGWGQ